MAPYMVRPDHPRQPYMVRGTIHGAVDGPGGHYMAEGDHPWRCGWSGRTINAAMDGPAGPSTAPWMVPRTMYGAVDGPAGPTVGGTIYGMTVPWTSI